MRKPDQPSNAGNLEEVADWGRLFLGYFLLAKQKKVTSCRATTDEVVLVCGCSCFDKLNTNGLDRYATPATPSSCHQMTHGRTAKPVEKGSVSILVGAA